MIKGGIHDRGVMYAPFAAQLFMRRPAYGSWLFHSMQAVRRVGEDSSSLPDFHSIGKYLYHLRKPCLVCVIFCHFLVSVDSNFDPLFIVGEVIMDFPFQFFHGFIGFEIAADLEIVGDFRLVVGCLLYTSDAADEPRHV